MEYKYSHNINPHVFALIPPGLKSIVEIGCGDGALGEQYKKLHSECSFYGVEYHPSAATEAKNKLDRVVCANVENTELEQLGLEKQSVDCMIYADVLEHLIDPWGLLAEHYSWLKPKGVVVASIPNVQHYSILLDLLRGRWEYTDTWLMDRTHLRFFTMEGIQSLFIKSGFWIEQITAVASASNPVIALFQNLLKPELAAELGIDLNRFVQGTNIVQYIVKAVKIS